MELRVERKDMFKIVEKANIWIVKDEEWVMPVQTKDLIITQGDCSDDALLYIALSKVVHRWDKTVRMAVLQQIFIDAFFDKTTMWFYDTAMQHGIDFAAYVLYGMSKVRRIG